MSRRQSRKESRKDLRREALVTRKGKREYEEVVLAKPVVPQNQFQSELLNAIKTKQVVFTDAPAGCVDKDTEFLSESGWKKISDYVEGDLITSVNLTTGESHLEKPLAYIKQECKELNLFKTSRGISQALCDDHNVVYYNKRDKDKANKIKVSDLLSRHHKNKIGFEGLIKTTSNFISGKSLGLSEPELRLHVAIKADAVLETGSTSRFIFILKKERKISRLKGLLNALSLEYSEKSDDAGFNVISFSLIGATKKYKDWPLCNKGDAKIIFDEIRFWGGGYIMQGNRSPSFYTSNKDDADYIQFVGMQCGYRSSITTYDRVGQVYNGHARKSPEYRIYFSKQTHIGITPNNPHLGKTAITKMKTEDGFKYCFTTSTGALLLRRDGNIFVTGNCGKTFVITSTVIDALKSGKIQKIILSRPSVGMGNSLGLLPGGMREKFEPYLMPIIDVITQRYGKGFYECQLGNSNIEFVPLEYLRGRSFNDAIVIVDEFQNTTKEEAFSIMTRLGETSQLFCMGDTNQHDMRGRESGLTWATNFIDEHDLYEFAEIVDGESDDIVRSGFCKAIVKAMEKGQDK